MNNDHVTNNFDARYIGISDLLFIKISQLSHLRDAGVFLTLVKISGITKFLEMQATEFGNSLAVEEEQDSKNGKESIGHTAKEKIVKDGGEPTYVSGNAAISFSEITVCPIVANAAKALYERIIAVYNCYKSLRKALIEHLVSFYRTISHYVFGNHNICGSWCQYKYPIRQRHRSLCHGRDLDVYDLKAELEQVW